MKVNNSASTPGIPPASLRAQEPRKPFDQIERQGRDTLPATPRQLPLTETSTSGNEIPGIGNILPLFSPKPHASQSAEHARGLAHAIEQLQKNSEKNPQAMGLLRALETLTEKQSSLVSVDTEA